MKNNFIKKTVRHRRNKSRKTLEHGKGFHALWPGRISMMKITILPKLTCKFNAIIIKSSRTVFADNENKTLKCIGKHKRLRRAKAILI